MLNFFSYIAAFLDSSSGFEYLFFIKTIHDVLSKVPSESFFFAFSYTFF